MSVHNYIPRTVVVERAGRRYVCRPPAYATVRLLLELYPDTVLKLAKSCLDNNIRPDPGLAIILFVQDREKLAQVLETCVELMDGRPGDLIDAIVAATERKSELAIRLCQAVLSLCDADRIVRSLNLETVVEKLARAMDATDTTSEGGEEIPEQIHGIAICMIAQAFGLDPTDVVLWPYEKYLDVADVFPHLRPHEETIPGPATQPGGSYIDTSKLPADAVNLLQVR